MTKKNFSIIIFMFSLIGRDAIIYSSSDKDIFKVDISLNYKKVGKLEKNWYYAIVK